MTLCLWPYRIDQLSRAASFDTRPFQPSASYLKVSGATSTVTIREDLGIRSETGHRCESYVVVPHSVKRHSFLVRHGRERKESKMPPVMDQSSAETRQPQSHGFHVTVLVAGEIVRHGLTAMLTSLAMVEEVHIWDAAVPADPPPTGHGPGILILGLDGLDAATAGRLAGEARGRGVKVLLLLNSEPEEMLDLVAVVPSDGILAQRDLTSESLAATLSGIAEGDAPMPAPLANGLLSRARAGAFGPGSVRPNLTPRERQVLELLVEGLSNKQIARRLQISSHGVKRLVSSVLAKLSCPNRTLAVAVAITEKIVAAE